MSNKGDDGFTTGLIIYALLCALCVIMFSFGWFTPSYSPYQQGWDRADNPFMDGQYARRR